MVRTEVLDSPRRRFGAGRTCVLVGAVLVVVGCAKSPGTNDGDRGAGARSGDGGRSGTSGTEGGSGGTAGASASGGTTWRGGSGGASGAAGEQSSGGETARGGAVSGGAGGGAPTAGNAGTGGSGGEPLGAYPFEPSAVTRGGTMTFTNVGAPGWWPRRLDREPGDAACTYKDGTDTWGGDCCMTEHMTSSAALSPFDEEMTLILKAVDVKQLAVYQPAGDAASPSWSRVSAWDVRTNRADNLWFTQEGEGSASFPGNLTRNDCVGYMMQAPLVDCADNDYYCPNDPGVLHRGFRGSKLVVLLVSMTFDDAGVQSCSGDGAGKPSPWVAFVASELVRDGGRKWNGLCNCYSKTGTVGDGCGEINVFEVVMDDNAYSNREFASTGIRSYQAGHVGGAVCQSSCRREDFPADADVVDACATSGYEQGPEIELGGDSDGCPVWVRPNGERYLFILLDQQERMIQVGMLHPGNIPAAAAGLLPELPGALARSDIDALLALRKPAD